MEPKKTPLWEVHKKLGAKLVDFAGWLMPLLYTGILQEHQATRTGATVFDVSHMGVFDFSGPGAEAFLQAKNSELGGWHR